VLRACRRVLKPGGRIAYFNIFITHDIPEEERRRLRDVLGAERYTRAEQQGLLRTAGFTNIEETDATPEYERIQRLLYEANARHAPALRRVRGAAVFDDRQASRKRTLENIRNGVLRRSLFVAERAGGSPAEPATSD